MRVAIYGYGKVGQAVFKALPGQVVGVVDKRPVEAPGVRIAQLETRQALPWREWDVDLVIDATGSTLDRAQAAEHLTAGAQRVLVTASLPDPDATLIYGLNHQQFDPLRHLIISASSCTTACLAPVLALIDEKYGLRSLTINLQHGYNPLNHDGDLDLGRIAEGDRVYLAMNAAGGWKLVPYGTNLAKNLVTVQPQLAGRKIRAVGHYIPQPGVLIIQCTANIGREVEKEPFNAQMADWATGALRGQLVTAIGQYTGEIIPGETAPTIFWPHNTVAGHGRLFIVVGGDYISGYAGHVAGLANQIGLV
ncbi:hypothetical protein A2311_04230 [candidate division WOR-1 bacterium RIFOXYB2_FULL_48_7]|nr:MAG: hypothetical protein A2311_04230 [candidate division WOR-1 bacterium RIFOXYB2_FULL_48_7]